MILKSNVRYISDNYISFIPLKNKTGDSESFSTKRGEEVMTLSWFYHFVFFSSADIEDPTHLSTLIFLCGVFLFACLMHSKFTTLVFPINDLYYFPPIQDQPSLQSPASQEQYKSFVEKILRTKEKTKSASCGDVNLLYRNSHWVSMQQIFHYS